MKANPNKNLESHDNLRPQRLRLPNLLTKCPESVKRNIMNSFLAVLFREQVKCVWHKPGGLFITKCFTSKI